MIQFNLLPNIKIQYLRANRQKHIIVLGAAISIVVCLVVMGLLLTAVYGLQKKTISDLNTDIKSSSNELRATPDLNKILTVQNQLTTLPELHASKPVVTRLFAYLNQAKPASVTSSRTLADFSQHTLNLSGTADSLDTIKTYVNRLKYTTYHTDSADKSEKKAFSNVTLSSFGRDAKSATYTVTLSFEAQIFSEADNVTFTIAAIPASQEGQ